MNATRLVLHHTYERRLAFDVSEHGNHGRSAAVFSGTGEFASSFRFTGGPSRVSIRPSPTLQQLRSLRVRVRFVHLPSAPGTRRHNLVEGHVSFALFVNPDGSLQGTIVQRDGTWDGVRTVAGVVQPNQWCVVELDHDSLSHLRLFVNGVKLAERFDIEGPVRSVGPNGVAVGHWPEPDDRYTFEGWIDDVRLWAWDPRRQADDLLDPCCLDRDSLDEIAKRVRAAGWTSLQLGQNVRALLDIGADVAQRARGGDPVRTARAKQLARDAALAIRRRDLPSLGVAMQAYDTFARQRLTPGQLVDFGNGVLANLRAGPLAEWFPASGPWGVGSKLVGSLDGVTAALCLDDLYPPGGGKGDGRPGDPRPKRPGGDPATDGDPGKPPPDWDADRPVDPE